MTAPTLDSPSTALPAVPERSGLRRFVRPAWKVVRELIKWPLYRLYEYRLEGKIREWTVPRHIGFIMDGNRRFARLAGSAQVSFGHHRGASKLHEVLSWCFDAGIPVVTVWSFSLDNFERDTSEVEALLELFEEKTRELAHDHEVHSKQVQVRFIGKLELLPESLQQAIKIAEEATASYRRFHLNIAMAYGGREEITDAFRRFLRDRAASGEELEQVAREFDGRAIEPYLYTSGLPEPDLIVRTSGEVRLSGFLLWQSAYSEFSFCDAHWPAFRRIDFLRALRSFHLRQRRYGK
jgi:short-chain Z-isoprenyl diphosphate synthase